MRLITFPKKNINTTRQKSERERWNIDCFFCVSKSAVKLYCVVQIDLAVFDSQEIRIRSL